MINRIISLFARPPQTTPVPHTISEKQIAAIALLVEAATLDGEFGEQEQASIRRIAATRFELNEDEITTLINLATQRHGDSNQLFAFTHQIKQSYAPEDRVEMMEMLWEVVYADGVLHDYEANLLRRIGGLIYVTEIERGEARKRVMARLGIG